MLHVEILVVLAPAILSSVLCVVANTGALRRLYAALVVGARRVAEQRALEHPHQRIRGHHARWPAGERSVRPEQCPAVGAAAAGLDHRLRRHHAAAEQDGSPARKGAGCRAGGDSARRSAGSREPAVRAQNSPPASSEEPLGRLRPAVAPRPSPVLQSQDTFMGPVTVEISWFELFAIAAIAAGLWLNVLISVANKEQRNKEPQ